MLQGTTTVNPASQQAFELFKSLVVMHHQGMEYENLAHTLAVNPSSISVQQKQIIHKLNARMGCMLVSAGYKPNCDFTDIPRTAIARAVGERFKQQAPQISQVIFNLFNNDMSGKMFQDFVSLTDNLLLGLPDVPVSPTQEKNFRAVCAQFEPLLNFAEFTRLGQQFALQQGGNSHFSQMLAQSSAWGGMDSRSPSASSPRPPLTLSAAQSTGVNITNDDDVVPYTGCKGLLVNFWYGIRNLFAIEYPCHPSEWFTSIVCYSPMRYPLVRIAYFLTLLAMMIFLCITWKNSTCEERAITEPGSNCSPWDAFRHSDSRVNGGAIAKISAMGVVAFWYLIMVISHRCQSPRHLLAYDPSNPRNAITLEELREFIDFNKRQAGAAVVETQPQPQPMQFAVTAFNSTAPSSESQPLLPMVARARYTPEQQRQIDMRISIEAMESYCSDPIYHCIDMISCGFETCTMSPFLPDYLPPRVIDGYSLSNEEYRNLCLYHYRIRQDLEFAKHVYYTIGWPFPDGGFGVECRMLGESYSDYRERLRKPYDDAQRAAEEEVRRQERIEEERLRDNERIVYNRASRGYDERDYGSSD